MHKAKNSDQRERERETERERDYMSLLTASRRFCTRVTRKQVPFW